MKKWRALFYILICAVVIGTSACSQVKQASNEAIQSRPETYVETPAPTAEITPLPTATPSIVESDSFEEDVETSSEPVIDKDAIPWVQAKDNMGETIKIYGQVKSAVYSSSSNGQPTFLNIGVDYPDPDRLAAVIWGDNRSNFEEAPEKTYAGKNVYVTGMIKQYKGTAQIEISDPAQIEIIE